MKSFRNIILGIIALGFLAANLVFFQVDATEYAIVTQFGNPVRVITSPGLYAKLPDPIQSVVRINNQLRVYNLPQTEFLTADKKNIVLEAYATWEVTDSLTFLKTVRDPIGAETRLADIVASELGTALGQVQLNQLVTVDAAQLKLPDTLLAVTRGVASRTEAYGFIVTDVRLKQLTFPQANLTSVFQRMKAEREAIARQFRSEGKSQHTSRRQPDSGGNPRTSRRRSHRHLCRRVWKRPGVLSFHPHSPILRGVHRQQHHPHPAFRL
jgi:membrane protease subunit HflC